MKLEEISIEKIITDLKRLAILNSNFIRHIGLFGSILYKSLSDVHDVDVLILYSGIDFKDLKTIIRNTPLLLSTYEAYLNVSYIKSDKKTNDPPGYHFILMPIDNPCWEFLKNHNCKIRYLTKPFKIEIEEPMLIPY